MRKSLFAGIVVLALIGCEKSQPRSETATEPDTAMTESAPARDNTAVNERDRTPDAKTAGAQGQGKSDVDITAEIRKRVTDTEMSVNAQNSKIVTENGKVTLRGPVKNQEEKDTVGRIAAEVAGTNNVDNQLEIENQ